MINHETTLENTLVYSSHRSRLLGQCPRKYLRNYIQSWGGWENTSSDDSHKAYRLKHLTTPELEAGTYVHETIRGIFTKARVGLSVCVSDEIKFAQRRLENFLNQSKRRALGECTAKRHKLLLHELGASLDSSQIAALQDGIAAQLDGFFGLADVKLLLANPSLVIWDFLDPSGFDIGEELSVPARLKTDIVFQEGNKLVIGDWKCGKRSDDHEQQGIVYDIYLRNKLALPPEAQVEVRFYYLGLGQVSSFSFDPEQRSEKLWAVGEEFTTLQSFSDDPVVNVGLESRFPAQPSFSCNWCNHQFMCREFHSSRFVRRGQKGAK